MYCSSALYPCGVAFRYVKRAVRKSQGHTPKTKQKPQTNFTLNVADRMEIIAKRNWTSTKENPPQSLRADLLRECGCGHFSL